MAYSYGYSINPQLQSNSGYNYGYNSVPNNYEGINKVSGNSFTLKLTNGNYYASNASCNYIAIK